jgi:hypothetical protein
VKTSKKPSARSTQKQDYSERISISGVRVDDPSGDLDEIFASRCYAHLERMSDQGFCLILEAGRRKVIVNLFTKRAKLGAFIFADETHTAAEEARRRRSRVKFAKSKPTPEVSR